MIISDGGKKGLKDTYLTSGLISLCLPQGFNKSILRNFLFCEWHWHDVLSIFRS